MRMKLPLHIAVCRVVSLSSVSEMCNWRTHLAPFNLFLVHHIFSLQFGINLFLINFINCIGKSLQIFFLFEIVTHAEHFISGKHLQKY